MSCRVADHAMFDGGQWFESPLEHTIKIDNFFTKAAISLKLLKSSKLLKFKSQNYKTSCKTVNKLACGAPLLPTQSRVFTAFNSLKTFHNKVYVLPCHLAFLLGACNYASYTVITGIIVFNSTNIVIEYKNS